MKFTCKNLLGLLTVSFCAVAWTRCAADAQEPKSDTRQVESSNPTVTNSPVATDASVTNQAPGDAVTGGTNQFTVIKAIPPSTPENLKLSNTVKEVVKLAQAGVSENVILLYIEKTTDHFNLDAADIVYLNDLGISANVVTAMLNHDGVGSEQQNALANSTNAAVAAAPAATNPATVQPGPAQFEVSSNYTASTQPGVVVIPDTSAQQQVQPAPMVVQQQPAVAQEPVVVTDPGDTYSYFYSSLAPYGSWAYVSDYGWCWQPTIAVVHSGWRPYCHGGGWLYSDCGWYWHSDYSWGWAPFHYGRWFCAPRVGWVWAPDYTWGPSWVSFRYAGDYCGWAPLPPRCYVRPGVGFTYWDHNVGFGFNFGLGYDHYTFVSARHFADHRVIDHVVPTERTANIYKNSTVVNNYIVGNNNTIVNNGISRDYIANHARTEIPKVAIREEPRAGRTIPADRVQKSGNELVVYRPTAPSAHTEAVHRQIQEQIRPSSAGPSVAGGVTATSLRPGAFSSSGTATVQNQTRPGGTAETKGEAPRTQVARNIIPAYGRPAPLRPEPEQTVTLRPTRPASQQISPINQNAISSTPVRPGSSALNAGSFSARSETLAANTESRTVTPTPSIQSQRSSLGETANQAPFTPQNAPENRVSQPVGSHSASSQSSAPTRTEIARNINTAPANSQPVPSANSVQRPLANNNSIPRYTPEPGASAAPEAIRPNSPFPQSIPSTTVSPPVSRNEGYGISRPATVPIQRAPIYIPAPPVAVPTPSAPVHSEAPRGNIGPAPGGGGQPRAAAAAPPAQAARPNVVQQQQGGRGRLEIGR